MAIDYDGRRFRSGDALADGRSALATYHQSGDVLWGEFAGGHAKRGALSGSCAEDGSLEFSYCMVLENGDLVSGLCRSTPEVLADGRIRLREDWQRFAPQAGRGISYLEEVADRT